MSKITTEIECYDLLSQLGKELVTSYTAEDATITSIVTALLAMQVVEPNITLGTIAAGYADLTRSIKVDGDTILRALFRLRDTVGGYIYVDNDRALQWPASIGEDTGQQIRYRKNLKGIERDIDYNSLVNRLYCYGAGEGSARIKLSDADGHAEDYVEDATSQGAPPAGWGGIYIGVMVDKSITHPDTLLEWGKLSLAEILNPPITYRIDTLDLSHSTETDYSFEALQLGSTVKIIDEDLGIDVSVIVVKIDHPDLLHPEQMEIELSTRTKDITDTLLNIYDRQQFDHHVATNIGAGNVVVKGAFTVIDWVTAGETTIDDGNIETHSIVANAIKTSTLEAVEITLGAGGLFKTAASPNARIEITSTLIAGYSDATTKQWWLDAATGVAYSGAGAIVEDATGIHVYGEKLDFYNDDDDYRGYLKGYSGGLRLSSGPGAYLALAGADVMYISTDAGDIELDPDGGDVIPGDTGETDLGSNTDYWDTIECVTLDDSHSPVKQVQSPLSALCKMNTKRKRLTLKKAKGLGKRVLAEVSKNGGAMDVDDKDIDTFPDEILDLPTAEDYDKAKKVYQRRQKRYKESLLTGKPCRKPELGIPHTRVKVFDEIWLMIRATQELNEKVDKLDAKIH